MASFVDVRAGERVAVFTAIGALLSSTAGHTMLETARDAMFLSKLPASTLPWMYLSIAGLGLLLTRLIPARKTSSTASIAMLVAAVVGVLFWVFLGEPSKAGLYTLFIWTGTFGAVVNTELWLLLGGAFDVGQAKRLFGLIGAGAVLGATIGAFIARLVAKNLGARQLLIGAGIAFLVAFVPALLLERKVAKLTAASEEGRGASLELAKPSLLVDLRATWKDKYLSRIGVFLILGTVTLSIGDYIFKAKMAESAKDNLATAFATAYLAFNGLSLIVQVGLTGIAMRWLGVKRALFVLPALVMIAAGSFVAIPTLVAAFALRSTDGALRHSLHKTTTELLFLPLLDADRRRAKPVIDLVAQRGGQAAAAVGMLVLVSLGMPLPGLAAIAVAFALGWVVMAGRVGAPYVDAFRKRLRKGALDVAENIPDLDLGALEALFSALNSSKDGEVMGALDLLAAQGRVRLIPALLLYHPSRDVVLRTLNLLTESERDDFLPVAQRLLDHADPQVRAAALRARAKVAKDREELTKMAEDERPEMRATALVALGSIGAVDAEEVHGALQTMLEVGDASVALAVVRAMGIEPTAGFTDDLILVARTEKNADVRSEAALSLGKLAATFPDQAPKAMEALLELLPLRQEGASAREAFETIGEPAIDFLDAWLGSEEGRGPVAWAVVRALTGFEPDRTARILIRHLQSSPDTIVRYRCLRYLKRVRSENPELTIDLTPLFGVTRETIREAFDLIELRAFVAKEQKSSGARSTAAGQLLAALFDDRKANAMVRIFMLLGLLHPQEDFDRVSRGLASNDNRIRASSRELCTNIVGPELRELLGNLIDDVDDDTRLDRALGKDRKKPADYGAVVRELATRPGELGALARYHARELGLELDIATVAKDDGTRTAFSELVDEVAPTARFPGGLQHAPA